MSAKKRPGKLKVLLLGGSGFLGRRIARFAPAGVSLVIATHSKTSSMSGHIKKITIDLSKPESLKKILTLKPQVIIHAARIFPYEENPTKANIVTNQFAEIVKRIGARLVYISTDAVFDGKKGNYKESDQPCPITKYGEAKLVAEKTIVKILTNYVIIRTSYLYSGDFKKPDKRTLYFLKQLKKGKKITAFTNVYRSPTSVDYLATYCWRLINTNFTGVINIAGKRKSIYGFCKKIILQLGYNPSNIIPAHLEKSNKTIPHDTSLETKLIKKLLITKFSK